MPKINWDFPDQTVGSDEMHCTELLNDYYMYLHHVNNVSTRGYNILDLVITSTPDQVKVDSILLPEESGIISDHNCIVFNVKTTVRAPNKFE